MELFHARTVLGGIAIGFRNVISIECVDGRESECKRLIATIDAAMAAISISLEIANAGIVFICAWLWAGNADQFFTESSHPHCLESGNTGLDVARRVALSAILPDLSKIFLGSQSNGFFVPLALRCTDGNTWLSRAQLVVHTQHRVVSVHKILVIFGWSL